jgi:hypothetical protein
MTNPTEKTTKLTTAELKANHAKLRDEAKAAHDPATGKFTFETFADYKTAYNVEWDFAHPDPKDALVETGAVLKVVDEALVATGEAGAVVQKEVTVSKMSLARAIFAAELVEKGAAGLVRKDILKRFQVEAGCTPAGANTYYNTLRDENNLVHHKTAAPVISTPPMPTTVEVVEQDEEDVGAELGNPLSY